MSIAFRLPPKVTIPRSSLFDTAIRLMDEADTGVTQIGLNFPVGTPEDQQKHIGAGSLHGTKLQEGDFTEWLPGCEEIAETLDIVASFLQDRWPTAQIGRTRLMCVPSRKCYSVHRDYTQRIHIPLITNPQAIMIWPEVPYVLHMPADGGIWFTDTTLPHTAMNGALADRWHLVAALVRKIDAD